MRKWKVKKPFSVPVQERENEGGINKHTERTRKRETDTYREKVCERRETDRKTKREIKREIQKEIEAERQ